MPDFASRIDAFLTEFFRINPTWATGIGANIFWYEAKSSLMSIKESA